MTENTCEEGDWAHIAVPEGVHSHSPTAKSPESIQNRIVRVQADQEDLLRFHNVELVRPKRLRGYYVQELKALEKGAFEETDQDDQVDYLLLKKYLERELRQLDLQEERIRKMEPLLPFAPALVRILEARQNLDMKELEPQRMAQEMHVAMKEVENTKLMIITKQLSVDKASAFRASVAIEQLCSHLHRFVSFFRGYNPLFDWWVASPYEELDSALQELRTTIQTELAGMHPDEDPDEIVGEPIGRAGLLVELEAEMIPYTPEELLTAAMEKYAWCQSEMTRAAEQLGFGSDWKAALEHVKTLYVPPGEQPTLVASLVRAGADYVKKHDLVTVPPLAEHTWRMFMMSPHAQKTSPFFLGGDDILVAYPTAAMPHADKLMSLRGNNAHFAKATAFHEMIPGHHLSFYYGARHRPYRRLFSTPFYTEGWAMYWELVLWARGDFFASAADRVGTLFWRMHRCARIVFSLKFHLGLLSAPQCVGLLVDMVGHERATAEGEVRRSLGGEYSPLYQAGYYLGALQLDALRREVLDGGLCGEKEFHDRVLRANEMPIELLRALLLGNTLTRDYASKWRFLKE